MRQPQRTWGGGSAAVGALPPYLPKGFVLLSPPSSNIDPTLPPIMSKSKDSGWNRLQMALFGLKTPLKRLNTPEFGSIPCHLPEYRKNAPRMGQEKRKWCGNRGKYMEMRP